MSDRPGQREARAKLHAPFRARRGRVIALTAAGLQAAILVLVAVILPRGEHGVGGYDRAGFLVLAAGIGWFLTRLGTVSAVPDEDALVVRNLLLTRRLEWAEILGVHFGGGAPWATLDLSDGDTLAVMAVQRADGERSISEANRLATLLVLHTPSS